MKTKGFYKSDNNFDKSEYHFVIFLVGHIRNVGEKLKINYDSLKNILKLT